MTASASPQCDTSRCGSTQAAHDIYLGGIAVVDNAGILPLKGFQPSQAAFHQIGQFEIIEEEIEKLLLRDGEVEFILSFAGVRSLAITTAAAATFGALDAITSGELLVAGMHHFALATTAVVKDGLGNVAGGNGD